MEALQKENATLKRQLKEALSKIEVYERMQEEKENIECAICLAPLQKSGKSVFRTSCGHAFHFKCVKEAVMMNQTKSTFCCPLCRKSFTKMTPPRTPLRTSVFPGFVPARALLTPTSHSTVSIPLSTQLEEMSIEEQEGIESPESDTIREEEPSGGQRRLQF